MEGSIDHVSNTIIQYNLAVSLNWPEKDLTEQLPILMKSFASWMNLILPLIAGVNPQKFR